MISFAFGPGGVTLMSGTFTVAPRFGLRSGRINSLVAENPRKRAADFPAYFAAPIRIIVVPQTGHFPFIAGLPVFSLTATGFLIYRLARHFTQSPCTMAESPRVEGVTPDKVYGPQLHFDAS